jgi:ketosteroid isomerase-like protein
MIAQTERGGTTMDTRGVVERYYQYAGPLDRTRWLALFDADVVMDEQLVGRVVGIEALTKMIGALDAAFPEFRAVPRHVVIDGDQACVIEDVSTFTADGAAIGVRAASYFRVAGGKITYFANVHDTAPFPRPPQH